MADDPMGFREKTAVENLTVDALQEMPCDDCGASISILFAHIVGARPVRLVCRDCARLWFGKARIRGVS